MGNADYSKRQRRSEKQNRPDPLVKLKSILVGSVLSSTSAFWRSKTSWYPLQPEIPKFDTMSRAAAQILRRLIELFEAIMTQS